MYDQTKHKAKKYFCMYCLQCFTTEIKLKNHSEICMILNGKQAIQMPNKNNNKLRFENSHKEIPVPFVIYADFEAITEKVQNCQPDNNKSFTEEYQKHTDCGYAYKVVCCYNDKYSKPIEIYRGDNAVNKFMNQMLKEVKYCQKILKNLFNKEQLQEISKKIPVIFHNLRGYDSHFIMQEIGDVIKNNPYQNKRGETCEMSINAIPNNMEKYMAFMLGEHLTFINSFQFMSSSLDSLVKNLPEDSFKYTSEVFQDEQLNLMKRKGIYPYDYMDSFEKFNVNKLPLKEEFYSILNDENISDDDYSHAKNIWNEFSLKNMGEYHDLYLKSDVLLLADIYENFRKTCLEYYKLDPCHCFTSPGLSWDAMLKMTGVNLELMTYIDMFQFIEKGMRGGISYIANRYGKANNKYMKTYNEKDPQSISCILMQTIYMVGLCRNIYRLVISNG